MTPLEVRVSLRRIRQKCSQRRQLLWQLLYPHPWHFQPAPLPATPDVLRANLTDEAAGPEASASLLHRNFLQLRSIPLFCLRDSPLFSLYRLYEDLCSGRIILMGYEAEYFFRHDEASWRLARMPDPKDEDAARYAVLASFVEAMVVSFNWKIELGLRRHGKHAFEPEDKAGYERLLETAPGWTSRVKPLAEPLDLLPPGSGDTVNAVFQKRNIIAPMGHLYNV